MFEANSNAMNNWFQLAEKHDQEDNLAEFRTKFFIPRTGINEVAYFCGNSLGLQPRSVAEYIQQELNDWAEHGVEGHFRAKNPWVSYHEPLATPLAKLTGSFEDEVLCMNQLTVNLNLLMAAFYRPQGRKYKILCEAKAFPSDQYAFASQAAYHGLDPNDAIIEVLPSKGSAFQTEDILHAIEQHHEELALVLFSGVNYYNGQVFDMKAITAKAHQYGIYCGFDLAHAIGNVPLYLHEWDVDFATWCSYKYLNSGPGGVSGIFVHRRFQSKPGFPAFAGWWGHDKASRFKMDKTFVPIPTTEAWQMSNAPVLSMAAHKASLDIFMQAGLDSIYEKANRLHEFLREGLSQLPNHVQNLFEVITPAESGSHGCQVSLQFKNQGRACFDYLSSHGIVADWREPDVIRMAPVALYNSFHDVARLLSALSEFK